MEDSDAGVPVDPPDEPQERTDDHSFNPHGSSQPKAFGRSEHRRRLISGRETRHDEQQYAASARQRPGPSTSANQARHSTNNPLRFITRELGGRFDSFNTLPSGADGADFVAKLVLYAHHQVYSNFFVGEARDTSILPYTKYALHHEHAYWGAAWFSCTSRRWLEGRSMQHTPQEMYFYSKSLESLRRALSDPSLATHESTISTILHLSFPPYLPIVDRSIPCPRQSNFKTWNLLHLATGLNVAEEHMIGLSTIVKLLGGIQNIQSAQIRRSVCFQGIHFSGRHLKAPLFPFASLHPIQQLVRGSRLLHSRQVFETSQQQKGRSRGAAFHEISFPETTPGTPQPAVVWAYLADMTTILEDYASGGSIHNQASLILDQMQLTQHSLLSLPPAADLKYQPKEEEEDESEDEEGKMVSESQRQAQAQIYEITRLAGICYANFVTYPTDYSTFPRLRLARLMLHQLEILYDIEMVTQFSLPEVRLVFWATVLGAIMAVGFEEERASFVALVGRSAADAKITTWMEAKELMESFLWHAPTGDADALKLWIEVQTLGRPSVMESSLPERIAGTATRQS